MYSGENYQRNAVNKLYQGVEEDIFSSKDLTFSLFYDVKDMSKEVVPVGLIVYAHGKKPDVMDLLGQKLADRFKINKDEQEIRKIDEHVDKMIYSTYSKFANKGRIVLIEDLNADEECSKAGALLSSGIKICFMEGRTDSAVCITGKENNTVHKIDKETFEIGMIEEVEYVQLWSIKER